MQNFDNIRPYQDDEVKEIKKRILKDKDFIKIVLYFFGEKYKWVPKFILLFITKQIVKFLWRKIHTINDTQVQITRPFILKHLKETKTKFTFSNQDKLTDEHSYLFISNHRDIVMDPAFLSYAQSIMRIETVRIGIGDNLLANQLVEDLMRLNKSFIIRRNLPNIREKASAIKQVSHFINYSIKSEKKSIWIAQKEGRAKDNVDKTDEVILKMFYLHERKAMSYIECLNLLNIVATSISYYWDPCDLLKAKELYITQKEGSYQKEQSEDVNSIVKGITKSKKKVHLNFSKVLNFDQCNEQFMPDKLIDREIICSYRFMLPNFSALKYLVENKLIKLTKNQLAKVQSWQNELEYSDIKIQKVMKQLLKRMAKDKNQEIQNIAIKNYANPILNRLEFEEMYSDYLTVS